ncbi:peptidylprolyl isomerase, partial [Candidatus Pelagibacter sp.]|nr:peptidylprolyl isomerase [Candidatus Pelagibacter sp.]
MSKLKILILLIILLNFNKYSNANLIDIKVKVQDEIITNLDIQNEKRYLFFLNPKLKELKTSRSNSIAKESLITETIKRKEIEKF